MKLYPQDLRDRLHAVIIRRRANGGYGEAAPAAGLSLAAGLPAPRLGKLGRQWTRGLGLNEREAAAGLGAASASLSSAKWTVPILVGIPLVIFAFWEAFVPTSPDWLLVAESLAAWGTVTSLSMTVLPRHAVRGLYRKPLSVSEIDGLLPGARTRIDIAYMGLIRDAAGAAVLPDAEAGLREALRALGRAADSLPPTVSTPRDTDALRRDALAARAGAKQEQDEVVAASWGRQADALERQAAALDRASGVTRRAQVLRAEVLAQMEALRAGLADFRLDAATDTALLCVLSESARRVAAEASDATQARQELEAFVTAPARQDATPTEIVLKPGQE